VDDFIAQLTTLRAMLAGGEETILIERLTAFARARRNWEEKRKTY